MIGWRLKKSKELERSLMRHQACDPGQRVTQTCRRWGCSWLMWCVGYMPVEGESRMWLERGTLCLRKRRRSHVQINHQEHPLMLKSLESMRSLWENEWSEGMWDQWPRGNISTQGQGRNRSQKKKKKIWELSCQVEGLQRGVQLAVSILLWDAGWIWGSDRRLEVERS